MTEFRLLALDIDGTVVNSRDEITPATQAALARAHEAGIHVVLATGRRYSRVLPLVAPLGIKVPLITASGALVKEPPSHRTLFRAAFAPGVLARVLRVVDEAGFAPMLYADTFDQGFDFYCPSLETSCPKLGEFLGRNHRSARLCPELLATPPDAIFAGFAMGDRDQMLALEALLNEELGEQLYVHVLRSPKYSGFMCEIAPAGVTKWSGILRLADQWGIEPRQICAVGDDVNDIPMIQGAGLGVAMGNAQPEVKAAADRVAPTNDEDGLVAVVDWLLGAPNGR